MTDEEFDVSTDGGDTQGDVTTDTSSVSTVTNQESYSTESPYTTDPSGVHTERADSTDEVDIQKLVTRPTLSDIRWLYRNTFARKIVNKPVDDAFKYGYEVRNDPTGKVDELLSKTDFVPKYQLARKKARRDGFALLYMVFRDSSDADAADDPFNSDVSAIEGLKVWTIDDLKHVSEEQIEDDVPEQYQRTKADEDFKFEVRKSGIVLSRDLGDVDYGDPIGYVLNHGNEGQFIHVNRVLHLVENPEVDGDFSRDDRSARRALSREESWVGEWEGDSSLQASYHLIKAVFKGDWATMQTLFRYSSPFYTLNLPSTADEDDLEEARKQFTNLNAKSEGVFPDGYEVNMEESDGSLEPEGYFSPVFDQICAAHEMTRSVLFGTQAGTVSGSEVDQQVYLNKVDRFRRNIVADDIDTFIRRIFRCNQKLVPSFALGFWIDWESLYKLNELKIAEKVRTFTNALKMASEEFYITPNEGRELLREELGDEYDIDLSEDLTSEDFSMLENLQMAQVGQETSAERAKTAKENPQVGRQGGGMQSGQKTSEMASQNTDNSTPVYDYS